MNAFKRFLQFVLVAAFCGCSEPPSNLDAYGNLNTWLVKTVQDDGVRNAIIAQHTLYPYHFVPHSEDLNSLGTIDLGVLAQHYRDYPGSLNIRRGNASDELYAVRIEAVREMLTLAGVDVERVGISDALPGGDGMPSERVLKILERSYEKAQTGKGTGSGRDSSESRKEGTSRAGGSTAMQTGGRP